MAEKQNKGHQLQFKPHEVIVVNSELKQFPFPSKDWKLNIMVHKLEDAFNPSWSPEFPQKGNPGILQKITIDDYQNPITKTSSKDIKVVVIDSLTRIMERIDEWQRRRGIKGYDKWDNYSFILRQIFNITASYKNKFVIYTGLEDNEIDSDGTPERTVKTKGKELRGLIESYFTIVLWANYDKHESDRSKAYRFLTNTDGICKAKSPMGFFNSDVIPNDLSLVLKRIEEYYNFGESSDIIIPNIFIAGASGLGKSASLRNLIKV